MSTILNDVRSASLPSMIVRDIEIESNQQQQEWNSFNFEPQEKKHIELTLGEFKSFFFCYSPSCESQQQ